MWWFEGRKMKKLNLCSVWLVSVAFALPVTVQAVERETSWVVPDLMMMDADADGIADQNDQCAGSMIGSIVDHQAVRCRSSG